MDEEFLEEQRLLNQPQKPVEEIEDGIVEKLRDARKDRDAFKNQAYELEIANKDLITQIDRFKTQLLENEKRNADLNMRLADLDYQNNQYFKERHELNKNIGVMEMKIEDLEDEIRRLKFKNEERKKNEDEKKKLLLQSEDEKT